MAKPGFVHLHCHSDFSLLDGAARISDMVKRAAELKMPAIALTDHGVMYGAINFYQAAKTAGVKPIIGCEVYTSPTSRFDKSARVGGDEAYHHLLLLAKNNKGYENLMRLVTIGFFEGFYYKPRVDDEVLAENSEGLIALSACLGGRIPKLIMTDRYDEAKSSALAYRDLFGEGDFYLEIEDHGMSEQKPVNEALFRLSEETGIPLVLTNDLHYVNKEDAKTHDVLLCIQTGSTLAEPGRLRFETEEFYLKSTEEMNGLFPNRPELLENTLKIADRCDVEIELERILLPKYEVPGEETLDSYFDKLCREGAERRFGKDMSATHRERLNFEIAMIKKMGFSGYFLVVQDFVNWAKAQGIKVGPGRGSSAGSLAAFVLNITNIDPLDYELLFERFLNPSRVTMPDIDIDVCGERRGEVIEYVTKKYGEDRVAQIIAFGTMAARAAIRDAGRVLDVPYGVVDKIAKLVPEGLHDNKQWTIEAALAYSPELRAGYKEDETTRLIIDAARGLDGLTRQDSIHAAAVVISDESLIKRTPLQRKGDAEIVTQYEMKAIGKIGLLKIDILGLRTLTVIDNAVKMIKETRGIELDIDAIPLDDARTFEMLRQGGSTGIFQFESSGMRRLLKDLEVSSLEDLISLNALYRPGPMALIDDFVDRKHERRPVEYLHPSMEPILKNTYGVMIYQEQVIQVVSTLAGFSMADADILRKAISKKEGEGFPEQEKKFVDGAVANGIEARIASKIFDQIVYFAGYGFNKSHSAAYAYVAYQTAYLKVAYPVEFMAALLTSVKGDKDRVAKYINECRNLKIEVLPPCVNESFSDFKVVGGSIRFGLSAVRNAGEGAIESIIAERMKGGPFTTIYDFCRRVDLTQINKRAIESLIKGGALDSLKATRRALCQVFENAVDVGIRKQRDDAAGVMSLFGFGGEEGSAADADPVMVEIEEWEKTELLTFEKEMLGLYVTDHPLLGMESEIKERTELSTAEVVEERDGTNARIGGIVSKVTRVTTKKGDVMARFELEDLEGSIEVLVFPKPLEEHRELIEEDKIVVIKGRLDKKEDEAKFIGMEFVSLELAPKVTRRTTTTATTAPAPKGKRKETPALGRVEAEPRLRLTIDSSRFDQRVLEELKSILSSNPGETIVIMRVKDGDRLVTLSLGGTYRVDTGNGACALLRALLGEDGVELGG